MLVSCASIQGISWLEPPEPFTPRTGSRADREARRASRSRYGGRCSGGSARNLSALAVARETAKGKTGRQRAGQQRAGQQGAGQPGRWRALVGADAHSSVSNTLRLLEMDALVVSTPDHRLTGAAAAAAVEADPDPGSIAVVVATAGTTNAGIIDDLAGLADVAAGLGAWFHVDGAYGGAGLFAASVTDKFAGIERADSFVVDPHKWLFAPFDCAALLYRDPALARSVHTQDASYLDVIHDKPGEWNPTDYAHHLTRRARGLPLWFSLSVHGVRAYADAIESAITLAREAAAEIASRDYLELIMPPQLSIVLFRRRGWTHAEYTRWAQGLLDDQVAPAVGVGRRNVVTILLTPPAYLNGSRPGHSRPDGGRGRCHERAMSGRDGAAVPTGPDEATRAGRAAEVARHEVGLRSLGQPNAVARQFDFSDDSYEWRRLFSELFGTFLLVLVAAGGPMVNARFGGSVISATALVVAPGLMVLAIILFMGAVSGAHLNPGVTIAFTLRGDFPLRRVPMYLLAQFAGAVLATLVLVGLIGKQGTAGLTLPGSGISNVVAMAWEAILTAGLVSVILGTASGAQEIGGMAAIAVGSYIALAGLVGAPVSGASMNPARSLGPALVLDDWTSWWVYLAGPLIGAIIAVAFAQILRGSGGGTFSRRAAEGTLGTVWLPGRPGHPAGPGGGGDDQGGDEGQGGRR